MVSIIIPNYNKVLYLNETLNSLLAQTYKNWECIIVDDHSSDNSLEIVQGYCKKDSRFKIYTRPNNRKPGGNAARNYGFEYSKGKYIQWLDSDDLIHPRKLEYQISVLEHMGEFAISVSNWEWFENVYEVLNKEFKVESHELNKDRWNEYPSNPLDLLNKLNKEELFIPIHSYLCSAELIKRAGLWNESLLQNQDGEFMTRVILKSPEIIFEDKILTLYRKPNSLHLSKQVSKESWDSWYDALVLCDKWILEVDESNLIKKNLALNYERLIKMIGVEFPELTQKCLDRIKKHYPNIRYSFLKPPLLWLGAWIGVKNFLKLRAILLIKN
ncbi:glycosyltransferase family 2 protein [Echinicola salinicaeni]|uniref:glycosyltransferase family 2 protein n=1 Tax=Echinicola salinicaeni TaxID=2762757 RepID=UPI00164757FA|nr:glycosyltransferase family 2 protein [Echinicola salinicaeni]